MTTMELEEQVEEHSKALAKLHESVIVLQRDQENLKEYVKEMKDDFKQDVDRMKRDIQSDFDKLRTDVLGAMKRAADAWPKWIGIVIAGLGVLVGVIGLFHPGW